ncbi:Zn-dependent oxidoreductase [Rhizobium sp. FY34]|uniref:Zn-dependent oxidoreductase n=1 Tax=Rhizobium sp. FY34 TaxID=2562309 RepID=UPI0010C06368|nr:Zn-dependent oxidoreductase [Rhizobium sp. FY34]
MKAICVTSTRGLEVRDVPLPTDPPVGHVLIDMDSAAINHGDKAFLAGPLAGGNVVPTSRYDVWGASGAGVVIAIGPGVPAGLLGRTVAVYKSLSRSPETIGLWCERAQVPYTCCVALPADVRPRDYSGSLVNIMTAYAFLSEVRSAGHRGVVVTAGRSATARALASIARRWNVPAVFVVRAASAEQQFPECDTQQVLALNGENFERELAVIAAKMATTAVFDGVGGELISRIAPILPMDTTIYVYGFLGGPVSVSFPTSLIMAKNITMRRFRVYESKAVKDPHQLAAALDELAGVIDDSLFMTKIGREFSFENIEQAMAFESDHGEKAVLVP